MTRPTPTTDALRKTLFLDSWETAYWKMKEHACILERELTHARELIAMKDHSLAAASATMQINNELMALGSQKINELIQQRDALKGGTP